MAFIFLVTSSSGRPFIESLEDSSTDSILDFLYGSGLGNTGSGSSSVTSGFERERKRFGLEFDVKFFSFMDSNRLAVAVARTATDHFSF